tara:strand:- start:249 stop:512 length:264 start_codon:yes stop_codon:yes gene_type:complete
VAFYKNTPNSLTEISVTYPPSREQTIAALSEFKQRRKADIDMSTLEAYVHYASEEYDKSFHADNANDQAWWDGALAMARWIIDAEGQ